MKTIGLSVLICLVAVTSLVSQELNLLDSYNGDFENGLTHWRFFEVPNNIGSYAEIVTTEIAHGNQAVKIVFVPNDGSVIDRGFDNFDVDVPVVAGESYTAKVQAKATTGENLLLRMTLGYFDLHRNVIDEISMNFPLTESYQTFSLEKEAPLSAATCWVAFRLFDSQSTWGDGKLFLDDAQIVGKAVPEEKLQPRVMSTQLPSEDVPIASIDITEAPYNAMNDGSVDATTAFQKAINFAASAGGAVIFVPAGRYRFDGSLLLREKVILRGDWQRPDNGGATQGTILMPYGGKGETTGEPFIKMERGSGIKNMTIWYPEQNLSSVSPYPWTIHCNPNTAAGPGDNTSIINITLINSYQGIKVGPDWNELHYIRNVFGTPLKTGIWLSQTTDIGRIMNVHFKPKYWSQSGLINSPDESALLFWLQNNAEGIVMGRSDWEYIYDVSLIGYKVGLHIFKYSDMAPNGVIYGLHIEKGQIGIKLDDVNAIGFAITGSTISASAGEHPVCVLAGEEFGSIVQFNSCIFGGKPRTAISFEKNSTGRLTFQNCRFDDWGYQNGGAAIESDAGSLAILGCEFKQDKLHLRLGKNVSNGQILNNSFPDSLRMINESKGEVIVTYEELDFPKLNVPPHPFAAEPRPITDELFIIQDYGAVGDGQADDTDAFQAALDAAGQNGGGTVYVPAGWYKINGHLTVPMGVELRGIWDVPHHTISRGSVLLSFAGKGNPLADPFIFLSAGAGVRGVTIWYPEQNSADIQAYPWAIQAGGANCWIKDVTIGNAYLGVDLATFSCPNHYVSYLGGSPLKTGLHVNQNPGQGWIENVQFNPHYWLRSSGYPKITEPDFHQLISFQQRELEAFRFGGCQQEHILGTFVYAADKGLYFSGEGGSSHADVFLHGTDAGSHGVHLEVGGDSELNFINSQLVVLGANIKGVITTGNQFTATASFFNTLSWGEKNGLTADINGDGELTLQQVHTRNHRFNINGGVNRLHNIAISQKLVPQFQINAAVRKVELFGNYAENGFKMTNGAGDRTEADYNFQQGKKGIKVETGWEDGQEQNFWNNTVYRKKNILPFSGETIPRCVAQSVDSAHGGQKALYISGKDNSSEDSYIYFKVFSVQIPVVSSTMLSYWLKPLDELGKAVHVDVLFTDGTRLSDFTPVADDSLPLASPRGKIRKWGMVTCRVGKYAAGKTTQTILVAYHQNPAGGDFSAFIDDLSFSTLQLLPEPWQQKDIGNARPQGYSIYDDGVFYMKGGGMAFQFTGDKFHFAYQKVSGDVSIVARLDERDDLPVGAFAGIMIRCSDSTFASLVALISSPRYGIYAKWRMPGTIVVNSKGYSSLPNETPLWFKLVRRGDVCTSYLSEDGTNWGTPLQEITVPMDSSVLVGMAVCSGSPLTLMSANFSHVEVSQDMGTAVHSDFASPLPEKFKLFQNYPNPFNSDTSICYDLPEAGRVVIAVYNVRGQKIKTILDQIQPGGSYKIIWKGNSEQGIPVASGLYFCHIQYNDHREFKKMVLIQ